VSKLLLWIAVPSLLAGVAAGHAGCANTADDCHQLGTCPTDAGTDGSGGTGGATTTTTSGSTSSTTHSTSGTGGSATDAGDDGSTADGSTPVADAGTD
jgi:hypothetical protein